jgi:chitinase
VDKGASLCSEAGLLLTAAVSPSNKVIDAGYDIPALDAYLDYVSVMTYDYHGQWDKQTGHVAPMYQHQEDQNTAFNAVSRSRDPFYAN